MRVGLSLTVRTLSLSPPYVYHGGKCKNATTTKGIWPCKCSSIRPKHECGELGHRGVGRDIVAMAGPRAGGDRSWASARIALAISACSVRRAVSTVLAVAEVAGLMDTETGE